MACACVARWVVPRSCPIYLVQALLTLARPCLLHAFVRPFSVLPPPLILLFCGLGCAFVHSCPWGSLSALCLVFGRSSSKSHSRNRCWDKHISLKTCRPALQWSTIFVHPEHFPRHLLPQLASVWGLCCCVSFSPFSCFAASDLKKPFSDDLFSRLPQLQSGIALDTILLSFKNSRTLRMFQKREHGRKLL